MKKKAKKERLSDLEIKQKILVALKEHPGTFEDLLKITKLVKSSLSKYLSLLEDEHYIERKLVPRERKERKQRPYKILIQLSPNFSTPIEGTVRLMKNTVPEIDVSPARRILADERVIEAILKIAATTWKEFGISREVHPFGKMMVSDLIEKNEFTWPKDVDLKEFNAQRLIVALARYAFERRIPDWIEWRKLYDKSEGVDKEGNLIVSDPNDTFEIFVLDCSRQFKKIPSEVIGKFWLDNHGNRKAFPALALARDLGVADKLDALLDWLQPYVFPAFKTKKGEVDLDAWLKFEAAPNFVSASFKWARETYLHNCIIPAWAHALERELRFERKRRVALKRKHKKGGEKA